MTPVKRRAETSGLPDESPVKKGQVSPVRERIEALFQQVCLSEKNYPLIKLGSARALALLEENPALLKGNRDLQEQKKYFLFSWASAVYGLGEEEHFQRALEYLKASKKQMPKDKLAVINLLRATIFASLDRPPTENDPCDVCVAIRLLQKITGAEDRIKEKVHKKLDRLVKARTEKGHEGCFLNEPNTPTYPLRGQLAKAPCEDDATRESALQLSQSEKGICDLIHEHWIRVQTLCQPIQSATNLSLAKVEVKRALGILVSHEELVQRIASMKQFKMLFHRRAAEIIWSMQTFTEYPAAIRHLNAALQLTNNPEPRSEITLLKSRFVSEGIDKNRLNMP